MIIALKKYIYNLVHVSIILSSGLPNNPISLLNIFLEFFSLEITITFANEIKFVGYLYVDSIINNK